jgi:glucosamine-6-phosphate deaminase
MSQGIRTHFFSSARQLGDRLCQEIEAGCAAEAGLVALAVGQTTLPHYAGLNPDAAALAGKTFLPVDELVPAPENSLVSFSAQLRRALPVRLSHRVSEIDVRDPTRTSKELEAWIEASGLAVCVLGLGPDGHIAFNQPGSGPGTQTRLVEILPANLSRLVGVAPATHALTLGVASLLLAARVLLVVDGAGKRKALERVLQGPETSDVPASFLRRHRDCRVLVVGDDEHGAPGQNVQRPQV